MKTRIFDLKVHPQDNSAVLRTGAAHPLPDFSGCVRTRRTRSNGGPVDYYVFSAAAPNSSANSLSYLKARFKEKPFVGKGGVCLMVTLVFWYSNDSPFL